MNRVGRHLEALDLGRHALRRDPREAGALWETLHAAVELRDRDAARKLRRHARTLDLQPSDRERFEDEAARLLGE
jgi:hypothetical protein